MYSKEYLFLKEEILWRCLLYPKEQICVAYIIPHLTSNTGSTPQVSSYIYKYLC
jgi:hypothetical protein